MFARFAALLPLHGGAGMNDADDTISTSIQLGAEDHIDTDRAIVTIETPTLDDDDLAPTVEHKGRALIIEDDGESLEILAATMARMGYEVRAAASVLEGVMLGGSMSWVPDLLVTDYHMPQFDGLAAVKMIRKASCHPSMPIVVLSGIYRRADADGSVAALEALGAVFIEKGSRLSEVLPRAIAEARAIALASPGVARVR